MAAARQAQARVSIPAPSSPLSSSSIISQDYSANDVPYYKDKASSLPLWINQCDLFFALQPTRFSTEELKIRYLVSRMSYKSRAARWALTFMGLPEGIRPRYFMKWDYKAFIDALYLHQGINRSKARQNSLSLKQSQAKCDLVRDLQGLPEFHIGQQVMLLRRNISTTRPTKEPDYTRLGPYRITAVDACDVTVDLGTNEHRLHNNVFHVSLIEPYKPPPLFEDRIEGQIPHGPTLDSVADIYRILNSRRPSRGRSYLVLRHGQRLDEATWHNYKDLKGNLDVLNLILRFHLDNPGKGKAPQREQVQSKLVAAPQTDRGHPGR